MTLYQQLAGHDCRTVALLGLAKNAGKTTAMNSLAAASRTAGEKIIIASIGRDGEAFDAVTGKPKPSVVISRGDRVITTDRLIKASGIEAVRELDLEITTPLGIAGLYRIISSGGNIVIAGINRVSAMLNVKKTVSGLADRFYIDGAINRRSSGVPRLADGIIVSTGAILGNSCAEVARRTKEAISILSLPEIPGVPDNIEDKAEKVKSLPGTIIHKGALTEKKALELLNTLQPDGAQIFLAVSDATKIFLSMRTMKILSHRGIILRVVNPLKIIGVTVNPHNPVGQDLPPEELEQTVRDAVAPFPVYNVKG